MDLNNPKDALYLEASFLTYSTSAHETKQTGLVFKKQYDNSNLKTGANMADKGYRVYGYRWVVLAVYHVHQHHHSDSMDLLCADRRPSREILWCF